MWILVVTNDQKGSYKTTFTFHFGHYKWNVMPFGLKITPSKFQNIMKEIFNLVLNLFYYVQMTF